MLPVPKTTFNQFVAQLGLFGGGEIDVSSIHIGLIFAMGSVGGMSLMYDYEK